MSSSFSSCTVTPSLVKIDIVPLLAVLPTLIRDMGNSLKVSACCAFLDKAGKGKLVMCWPFLFYPFATMARLVDGRKMGRRAAALSLLLM